nr:unnamed protein product [Spirometra erinaceieuropaei]
MKGIAPLLSSDISTPLTKKSQILKCWAEHFRSALNRPSTISDATVDWLLQVETNIGLDLASSLQETICAVLMFSAMLMDIYHEEHPRIRIAYRTHGHLLNSRRMQAPARLSTVTIQDLLFASDCVLKATT